MYDPDLLEDARRFFAALLSRVSGQHVPEIEAAFIKTRREDFVPPGPWQIFTGAGYIATPSADPVFLQQDVLIGIDVAKKINNGQPSLHARWIAAASPKAGERVLHVGCGNGFYTAILAELVGADGHVSAFEIEADIAASARHHLKGYSHVDVFSESAASGSLPESDLIYVNAGVPAPLANWLGALRPGGRLVFPWQVGERRGVSVLITRQSGRFGARVLGPSTFIPLRIESALRRETHGGRDAIWKIGSLVANDERPPDDTRVAVFDRYWFSTNKLQ